jgi:hypothetical protein
MQLDQHLRERSVLDAFISAAQRQPEHAANSMLMTGTSDDLSRNRSEVTTVRLKVEQIQLVSGVGHVGLGHIGLQGA